MELIEGLERRLPKSSFRERYPGQITIYKKHFKDGMHTGLHAPYDPRIVGRLWRAGTIRVYDTYLGTDKMGHFVDMGYRYYEKYRSACRAGKDAEEAMAAAVYLGTGDPLISERAILGKLSSGAYSNADLASNYVGCLLFRNLTEVVILNGKPRAPTTRLNDEGEWEVAEYVTRHPQFFKRYICDHYNEALNPSLFDKGMRKKARKVVAARRGKLVDTWYAAPDGSPYPPSYFTERALALATYCGMDYGHSRRFDELIHLGNTLPEAGK